MTRPGPKNVRVISPRRAGRPSTNPPRSPKWWERDENGTPLHQRVVAAVGCLRCNAGQGSPCTILDGYFAGEPTQYPHDTRHSAYLIALANVVPS